MATISYYLTATTADSWRVLSESTQAAATLSDGWIVSTGSTNHSEYEVGVERAAATFSGTTVPDGTLDTTIKDAFRSPTALTGSFAAGTWDFHGVVRAVTNGGAQDGRVRFRLIKADADGSNATEITSAQQSGALVSNVATSADSDSNLGFNPGFFTITNQYLFLQIAWERTGAGGMTSSDIAFRTGSASDTGTRLVTTNFQPNITPSAGGLSFAGVAATIALTVLTGAGGLTHTGAAPGLSYKGPEAGSVVFTGEAPTVVVAGGSVMLPPAGGLVFTGVAPTVLAGGGTIIEVPAGSLVYTGVAPGQSFKGPDPGGLTYTGAAPSVNIGTGVVNISVPAGGLVLDGEYFDVLFEGPESGTLVFTGVAPALAFTITTGAGGLTYAGQAPILVGGGATTALPDAGGLVYTGVAPVASVAHILTPGAGGDVFTGAAPTVVISTVSVTVTPSAGGLRFTGLAPSLVFGTTQPPQQTYLRASYTPSTALRGSHVPATDVRARFEG